MQVSNKFAALEAFEERNEQNQLAIVEAAQEVTQVENISPAKEKNRGSGSRSPKKASPTGNKKGLNPSGPNFNPFLKGSEAAKQGVCNTLTGRMSGEQLNVETTSLWVQRAFVSNVVATNTFYQEIPSQVTRVDNNLAKKQKKEAHAESEASDDLFTSTEKTKWTGGRLWEDQIEEDSEEGDIPDGMQAERDSDVDIEEE